MHLDKRLLSIVTEYRLPLTMTVGLGFLAGWIRHDTIRPHRDDEPAFLAANANPFYSDLPIRNRVVGAALIALEFHIAPSVYEPWVILTSQTSLCV